MNIPDNIPIIFYFRADSKQGKELLAKVIEEDNGVQLLSMTDEGYFHNKFQLSQGKA